MKSLGLLLFFLGVATIAGAGVILVPAGADAGYWLSVLWVAVLFGVNWFVSTLIFSGEEADDRRTGNFLGVVPAVGVTVFLYSLISLAALAAYHGGLIGSKMHALAQLISFSIGAFTVVSTMLAFKGAKS